MTDLAHSTQTPIYLKSLEKAVGLVLVYYYCDYKNKCNRKMNFNMKY